MTIADLLLMLAAVACLGGWIGHRRWRRRIRYLPPIIIVIDVDTNGFREAIRNGMDVCSPLRTGPASRAQWERRP